jgi:hypothetical protein
MGSGKTSPNEMSRRFDATSPTWGQELEAFVAEVERWQRAAGITAFARILEADGHFFTVRYIPGSKEKNTPVAPTPEEIREAANVARNDGFERKSKPAVALEAKPQEHAQEQGPSTESPELKAELMERLRRGGRW